MDVRNLPALVHRQGHAGALRAGVSLPARRFRDRTLRATAACSLTLVACISGVPPLFAASPPSTGPAAVRRVPASTRGAGRVRALERALRQAEALLAEAPDVPPIAHRPFAEDYGLGEARTAFHAVLIRR
jgi:hypothetical protein